jgi:hypothetical protein
MLNPEAFFYLTQIFNRPLSTLEPEAYKPLYNKYKLDMKLCQICDDILENKQAVTRLHIESINILIDWCAGINIPVENICDIKFIFNNHYICVVI